ncbi:MAG: hypothetical protein IPK19_42015 [Chloroflexi bacterium]|nr:hypothetical protein [Chloroflexota bacterium]
MAVACAAGFTCAAPPRRKLPGQRVGEGPSSGLGDPAVNAARDGLGLAYRFFRQCRGPSWSTTGHLPLVGTVHYWQQVQRAFWNGKQMVSGDGDQKLFNRFHRLARDHRSRTDPRHRRSLRPR